MKKKKSNTFNIVFSAVLLGLFFVFLVGVILWETSRDEQSELPNPTETYTTQSEHAGTETVATVPQTIPTEATQPEVEPRQINFLLVGRDWHSEGENGRSDTMILCNMDTGAKTVTMISFLRDIYLPIPGHGSNRLNASYSWGGSTLLNETLAHNFGVSVDVNLEIDFDGFETMIDYLGGVDIDLTDREAKYLNNHYGWTLMEGRNHLDGSQALAYSRIRYIDSDFVRTLRQQNVLTALMERFREATLQEALGALDVFLDESTSNLTDEELLSLMLELYPALRDSVLAGHQVPTAGTYKYATVRGMSVIEANLEANRVFLQDLLEGQPEE